PNHPSYIALHASQSEAAAQALAAFFGTDRVSFTVTWPDPLNKDAPDVQRSFDKFTAAAHEAGMSRIYGGIHWSFDGAQGWHVGRNVGQYVAENFFLSVTSSTAGSLTNRDALGRHSRNGVGSDASAVLVLPGTAAALGGSSFSPTDVSRDNAASAS